MLNNPIVIGIMFLVLGSIIGYFIRQYLAVSKADSVEGQLKIKIQETKDEAKEIVLKAKEEATHILEDIRRDENESFCAGYRHFHQSPVAPAVPRRRQEGASDQHRQKVDQ